MKLKPVVKDLNFILININERFTMNNYRKWTGAQREKSYRLFCKAKDMGLIEAPHKCEICGQTKGILMTHNTNYNVTLSYLPRLLDGTANEKEKAQIQEVLIHVCWRCHMILHSYHRNPTAYKNYFHEVKNGAQYPPVYKHNFDILKENGF